MWGLTSPYFFPIIALWTGKRERIHLQETILSSDFDFNEMALKIFQLQYKFNAVYRMYLDKLHIDPKNIIEPDAIPFLPIQFFKYQLIQTGHISLKKYFIAVGLQVYRGVHMVYAHYFGIKKWRCIALSMHFIPVQSTVGSIWHFCLLIWTMMHLHSFL